LKIDKVKTDEILKNYSQGLSNSKIDLEHYQDLYGLANVKIPEKGIFELFFENIFNPFNVFQVFSVILWFNDG